MQTHIVNPKTNRLIKIGSKQAIRLAKEGIITLPETAYVIEEKQTIQEPAQSPCSRREPDFKQEPQPVIIQPENSSKTKKIKKELKEIAQENKEKFVGISQEQSDELLKKMLYEKLFVNKPTSDKKKKKKKKRVIVQSSSDDSDSDSESDW